MNNEEKLIEILKALSTENRLRIAQLLSSGPRCSGAISSSLGISGGATSQHLHQMLHAGIIIGEKKGNFIHYSLNREILDDLSNNINEYISSPPVKSNCIGKEKHCVRK